jgi:hypothetical protein
LAVLLIWLCNTLHVAGGNTEEENEELALKNSGAHGPVACVFVLLTAFLQM